MILRTKHFSRVLLFPSLLQLVILTEFMNEGTLCKNVTPQNHLRKSRSITTLLSTIPKDEKDSQTADMSEMSDKIANLESSVHNITGNVKAVDMKIEKISAQVNFVNVKLDKKSEQTSRFQQLFIKQLEVMQELNGQVGALKQTLSEHGEIFENLETIASTDTNLVPTSNDTCGGVLVGQSGSIRFTESAFFRMGSSPDRPSHCVWTIRAKNRRALKIETPPSKDPTEYYQPSPEAYLVEIHKNDGDVSRSGNGSAVNFYTKLTKLEPNSRYICNGPVAFIVYVLPSSMTPLHLDFEGVGKLDKERTSYSHENLQKNSGSFSINQLNMDDLIENNNVAWEYTSIVIAKSTTRAYLQASLDNQTCAHKDTTFVVVTDLLQENTTSLTDCCRQGCMGKQSLLNIDSPFIIVITKKAEAPLKFNLSWEADTAYPSSSVDGRTGDWYSNCGGVVGGSNGNIEYKSSVYIGSDVKCIWTIVPQPWPRDSIEIEVTRSGVVDKNAHLYMMMLTDVNGTELADGPKITHLKSYETYTAHSRELYIVLYTDSSSVSQGFSLTWTSTGSFARSAKDVAIKFTTFKQEYGTNTSLQERSGLERRNLQQVILVLPTSPYSSMYGMKLNINQTQPTPAKAVTFGGSCLHKDITVYTAKDGLFRKIDINCSSLNESAPGQLKTEIPDGMAMIVLTDEGPDKPFVALNFSWQEEYGMDQEGYITVENDVCGGVIKGEKGLLKYKLKTAYTENERCVWLLQSPNHSRVKLELLKDGYASCCDKIIVNTIDPSTGTLRNDTTIIHRANNSYVFNDSVMVITFFSSTFTSGYGFALQFTGEGDADHSPDYSYQLHHRNEEVGTVNYPGPEWQDPVPGTKEILVTAVSYRMVTDVDSLAMATNITFISGVFKREREGKEDEKRCTYESISFYTNPSSAGWRNRIRFPQDKDIVTCPAEIVESTSTHVCSTKYGVFLAIYRRLSSLSPNATSRQEESGNGNEVVNSSNVAFSFHKSSGCGGVVIGDSGAISYSESKRYGGNEKCVWLIEAPQAKRIQFYLEDNGFEACCDFLYIYTFSRDGTLVSAANITANSTLAIVDGPVVIVVFTSDRYVNEYGFVLRYSTIVNATKAFPYIFLLEHRHQLIDNSFNFQVEENQLVVAALSRDTKSLDSWSYPSSSNIRVNVTALRPQLDETCHSDQLTFYNVLGKGQQLVPAKNFTALQVLKGESLDRVTLRNETLHEHCPPLGNSDFGNCSTSIAYCTDKPTDNTVDFKGTSFIAVYKSVNNVSAGDLEYRGFSIYMYRDDRSRYPYPLY